MHPVRAAPTMTGWTGGQNMQNETGEQSETKFKLLPAFLICLATVLVVLVVLSVYLKRKGLGSVVFCPGELLLQPWVFLGQAMACEYKNGIGPDFSEYFGSCTMIFFKKK